MLIRKSLLQCYKVTVLDKTYEGILWIKFTPKDSDQTFNLSVCYLPPEGSTFHVNDFYETLLSQIYIYQNEEVFFVCRDFNSRNSDTPDFIEGMDDVPERETVDFTQNMYGDRLIDLLLSSNCCVLNGRKDVCSNTDYTSISVKGLAVVDYCLVPHVALPYFSNFKVHRSRQLFNEAGCVAFIDPSHSLPDHSMLTLNFMCNLCSPTVEEHNVVDVQTPISFTKWSRNIPGIFSWDKIW